MSSSVVPVGTLPVFFALSPGQGDSEKVVEQIAKSICKNLNDVTVPAEEKLRIIDDTQRAIGLIQQVQRLQSAQQQEDLARGQEQMDALNQKKEILAKDIKRLNDELARTQDMTKELKKNIYSGSREQKYLLYSLQQKKEGNK